MKFHPRSSTGLLDHMVARQATDISVHTGSTALIYLIHGVTGTPAEMRYLAHALARQGCDTYATTLPGHCRRLRDLADATEQEWRDHVHTQLAFARKHYPHVFAVGLSAGGHLALDAAAFIPLDGIAVLSPTFFYDGWNTPWSNAILPLAMKLVPLSMQRWLFHIDGPPFGIKDPALQEQIKKAYHPWSIVKEWAHSVRPWPSREQAGFNPDSSSASSGYPIFPLISLTQIDLLIQRIRGQLNRVRVPTLILQAIEDDMTSPRNAEFLYSHLVAAKKKIVLLKDCYHVITVDKQKKAVAMQLGKFFNIHTMHPAHRDIKKPLD